MAVEGPYEIAEVVNRIDYKIDVNGMVNMYRANMLNQYVERRIKLSHCLLSAEVIESVDDDDYEELSFEDCTFRSKVIL